MRQQTPMCPVVVQVTRGALEVPRSGGRAANVPPAIGARVNPPVAVDLLPQRETIRLLAGYQDIVAHTSSLLVRRGDAECRWPCLTGIRDVRDTQGQERHDALRLAEADLSAMRHRALRLARRSAIEQEQRAGRRPGEAEARRPPREFEEAVLRPCLHHHAGKQLWLQPRTDPPRPSLRNHPADAPLPPAYACNVYPLRLDTLDHHLDRATCGTGRSRRSAT
mmetsp:Transcript_143154/g.398935  ORF Transcript_143154/g.398935 Transcript_143154/m.398935 type:complete len:222 (-) Transcript_143154:1857-2522(-)